MSSHVTQAAQSSCSMALCRMGDLALSYSHGFDAFSSASSGTVKSFGVLYPGALGWRELCGPRKGSAIAPGSGTWLLQQQPR